MNINPKNNLEQDTRVIIERIEPIDELKYSDIDLNRLTVYGLDLLNGMGIHLTFERICVALFKLFPKKFSMAEFDQFPDGTRVNRALLQLRPKYRNWVIGSIKKGYFNLTSDGQEALDQAKILLERDPENIVMSSKARHTPDDKKRDIHLRFMRSIERSNLFSRYVGDNNNGEPDWDLYDLLNASEETPPEILRANLLKFESYAKGLERHDILEFIAWVRSEFEHLLKGE